MIHAKRVTVKGQDSVFIADIVNMLDPASPLANKPPAYPARKSEGHAQAAAERISQGGWPVRVGRGGRGGSSERGGGVRRKGRSISKKTIGGKTPQKSLSGTSAARSQA